MELWYTLIRGLVNRLIAAAKQSWRVSGWSVRAAAFRLFWTVRDRGKQCLSVYFDLKQSCITVDFKVFREKRCSLLERLGSARQARSRSRKVTGGHIKIVGNFTVQVPQRSNSSLNKRIFFFNAISNQMNGNEVLLHFVPLKKATTPDALRAFVMLFLGCDQGDAGEITSDAPLSRPRASTGGGHNDKAVRFFHGSGCSVLT